MAYAVTLWVRMTPRGLPCGGHPPAAQCAMGPKVSNAHSITHQLSGSKFGAGFALVSAIVSVAFWHFLLLRVVALTLPARPSVLFIGAILARWSQDPNLFLVVIVLIIVSVVFRHSSRYACRGSGTCSRNSVLRIRMFLACVRVCVCVCVCVCSEFVPMF